VGSLHANATGVRARHSDGSLRDFAAAYLQVHFPNTHGGLTPAALVNVRFCIAKGVISPVNEHPSKRQERGT
jgi:hypothetical protein